MLDPDRVNLAELCTALEDNSPEHQWWLDLGSGELELRSQYDDLEAEAEHPEDRGLVRVEPIGSRESYRDMEDFAQRARDPRARELLQRAIAGRGAFRRFKDTLLDFPDLREAWFRFHDARMERRAIEWLRRQDLIAPDDAERALAARPDPDLPELAGALDAHGVAGAVAHDLRELYGARLKQVVLFGSWARGDASAESDIDLLVILDEIRSRREELDRMNEILWRHSLDNDVVVTELPVSEDEFQASTEPLLIRARAEGVPVG